MVAVSLKKNFFKQKTAYEIGCCDWSSDVCSSDLANEDQSLVCSDHAFGVSERLGCIALFVLACLRRYSLRMKTHDEIAVL